VLVQPYFSARLQDLVWGRTRSTRLQFDSRLRFRALALLTAKNLLLTVATLGLYWPFAAVQLAQLRLAAISLRADGDIESWTAGATQAAADATGDAAGDVMGIDIGL
jgi:uncharacterized membrane protein YjgN (DUF898 family)